MAVKTTSKDLKAAKSARAAKAKEEKAKTEGLGHPKRVNMLREPLIDKHLEEYGLDIAGTVEEKATALEAHFNNTVPFKKLSACVDVDGVPGCGYVSDVDLSGCPYCGDSATLPDDVAAKAEPPSPAPAAITKATSKLEAIIETKGEVIEEHEITASDREGELDRAVAKVREVQATAVATYWDLGKALDAIHAKQLYFQRRGADGKPLYRGWNEFLQGEFDGQITPGHSYRVMDVARRFDRDTAVKIGVAKLSLLVRAKDEALPKLLERAPTLSVKELAVEAKPALVEPGTRETGRNEMKGGRGRSSGSQQARTEGRVMASKRAEAQADNKVTVASTLGMVELPLFVGGSNEKVAKKLSDDPHTQEVHVNGVVTTYQVAIGATGGLVLRINRRRTS